VDKNPWVKILENILQFILHLMAGFLTSDQIKSFERMHRVEKRKQPSDKIKAILLLNRGFSHTEVASILLIDMTTVWRWHQIYAEKGLDGLLQDNYCGGSCKLSDAQLADLNEHLENHVYMTAKEICVFVKKTFKVKYTSKGMTSLLHQLDFTYKKPKHIPGKANSAAQQEFIEMYTQLKEDKAAEDRIYFADAAHTLHNSQPAYGWIKKGINMVIPSNTGRQRINLNGAYCIEDHSAVVHESETVNAQSTIELLKEIMRKQPLGLIYIILDNAKYYHSQLVSEFLNQNLRVQFLFLPPYSPNLNVIERLWKFFKKKVTYNSYYAEFAVFRFYCLNFFKNIKKYRPELETLLTDNFQLIQA
jgi:transposase